MNIISLRQNTLQPQSKPTFQANSKIAQERLIKGISENLMSSALKTGDTFELSTIINDPKKNKVFFATLGSLMTAAAIKITELLTGDASKEETETGDIIELSTSSETENDKTVTKPETISNSEGTTKFIKHSGKQSVTEKALESEIKTVTERLNLDRNYQNDLVELFNQFCGVNHKGISYDNKNNEVTNSSISESIVTDLQKCPDLETLDKLIAQYKLFTTEKNKTSEIIEVKDEEEEASPKQEEIQIPANIQTKQNLKNVYINMTPEERTRVGEFLVSIDTQDKVMQKIILQKLNKNYSDSILEIATAYKYTAESSTSNQSQEFLVLISNGLIDTNALKNYLANAEISKAFSFAEYNSLIKRGISDSSIEKIITMHNCGEIQKIMMHNYDEGFDTKIYQPFLGKSFKTILKLFKALNEDSSKGLNPTEKEYTTDDIDLEIRYHKETYPNLVKYLSDENKKPLNLGKKCKLLEIYNGAQINLDLFTLHSYLRFLERYVMPEFNSNEDTKIFASQIKRKYCDKVALLKNAINNAKEKTIEVSVYTLEDANIKAPKIKIPYGNNGDFFEITINDQGKIHTIF